MKKIIIKKLSKNRFKYPRAKTINRFWGLAARLEHRRISGKKQK